MAASLLVIHGGEELARTALATERRALWSMALPLVLEKHGYVDVETRGPDALADPEALERRAGVLIARQAEATWTGETVARIVQSEAPVLLEAPAPQRVLAPLGIRSEGPLPPTGSLHPRAAAGPLRIAERRTEETTADPSLHWSVLVPDLITAEQADAWRRTGWDAFRWTVAGAAEVLAEWRSGSTRAAGIVRHANVTATCFGLFGYLAQAHTADPWEPGELRRGPDTLPLERLLLSLIDEMYVRAGLPRVRLRPWPAGHRWALNVRHDFDRSMPRGKVAAVLRAHRSAGTRATWYWRARHLRHPGVDLAHLLERSVVHTALDHPEPGTGRLATGRPARLAAGNRSLRLVARDGRHEIALHTELMWIDGESERRLVERACGARLRGSSSHGDVACVRFQGAANLLWAERHGLAYTENLQAPHRHPYRPAMVEPDGTVRLAQIVCLPKHASLDVGLSRPETYAERVAADRVRWEADGGLMQVMNHPDINQEALFELLSAFPADGRLDITARDAVDWWLSSHVHGRVGIVRDGSGDPVMHWEESAALEADVTRPDGRQSVIHAAAEADQAASEPRRAAIA